MKNNEIKLYNIVLSDIETSNFHIVLIMLHQFLGYSKQESIENIQKISDGVFFVDKDYIKEIAYHKKIKIEQVVENNNLNIKCSVIEK